MQASIVDLRYKTKEILKALNRNEKITILYHGKKKGVIIPVSSQQTHLASDHPYFGMSKEKKPSVKALVNRLRAPRHDF